MYRHILVALEHSEADRTILDHVGALARLTGARLLLVHVADGWAARNFDKLKLRESEEMRNDRAYLEQTAEALRAGGLAVDTRLAMGDPAEQLIAVAEEAQVDLIAMATHGHRFIKDLALGSTVSRVRHEVKVPVLLLRAQ
ncbi:MAG TPA: universal stress protein [Vicinamibacterales bacterium]|nr:universal stress protein [Vicinamibacterales bacterium]